MSDENASGLNRRTFYQMALAAFAGLVSGSGSEAEAQQPGQPAVGKIPKRVDLTNPLLLEPNICRGMNICKGKGRGDGRGGPNKCVGMSICATAPAHTCAGNNQCRGLGACDEGTWPKHQPMYPGENTCRGKGACGVPIPLSKDSIWEQARLRFESVLIDAGGRAGPAPRRLE